MERTLLSTSTTVDSNLRRAIHLISSLISISHSIRVFAAKWQLIRTKLEELHSALLAAENSDSANNPLLAVTLCSIMTTVDECHDLARRCAAVSYSGKLLMQSDLDVTLVKFNHHVNKLSELYDTGILIRSHALVVSKPCLGGSKEDMRFYIRDLLTRMKIGDLGMKKMALINLHEVVVEDDRYVKVIVEAGDVVHVLVEFLVSSDVVIQEESVKVVALIAGYVDSSYKGVLIGAGVVASLIKVLECGSDVGKVGAAWCLMKLTENSDNAWSVSAHGGVNVLLRICCNVDSKVDLICHAIGVLRNLVGVEEIKRFMVEEGAVSMFIRLVRSRDEAIQVCAIEFIQDIAFKDELGRQIVVREGGVRVLLRVLDPKFSYSSKIREVAMRAIEYLCFSSSTSVTTLMSYGVVDHVLYYLRNGEVSVQELALKLAFRLCGTSEEAKKALGDAGFIPELVKFLNAKSFEVREMAAETLSGLVMVPRNRKKFVQEDKSIALLLQLVDPGVGNSCSKKFLISILMSLTKCNSGKKKIISSGYAKNIEKLAASDICSDAKKLVKKLSTNRFHSIFSRIWHS